MTREARLLSGIILITVPSIQYVLWTARIAVPLAAILISAGFFFSMLSPGATQPSSAVGLIYVGAWSVSMRSPPIGNLSRLQFSPDRYGTD